MVTTIHLTRDQAPGIGWPVNEDSTMNPESIHSSSLDDKVYRTSFPNKNDVLCGPGGNPGGIINSHPGNEQYRSMVDSKKRVYVTARYKREKRLIATSIVEQIRSMDPPGRFLQKDMNSKTWVDIGVEKSREKTIKALRKNARDVRTLKPAGTRKGQWSEEEDAFVLKVIAVSPKQPFVQWTDLAALLPGKSGKQIRDRWINYLNPSINHLPFSREDDLKLWHGHAELGKRWAEIGEKIFNSTRSENHIKNRWYSAAFKKFIASEFGNSAYIKVSPPVSSTKAGKKGAAKAKQATAKASV